LSYNNFTGQIPSSLSNLKDLTIIDFSYNNFGGRIPDFLTNLTKLTEVYLSSNNFTGQIPSSLSNLKDLTIIDFSYNNFGGRIPDFLTNLTKLTKADLSYNQLSSQICDFQPGNSLESLFLNNNRLYGSIPKSISNLVNLIELDISSNNLSGIVKFELFTKFQNLSSLLLSHNSLSLSINKHFNYTFPKLGILELASCNITEFPNFFNTSFEELDLSNNRIYGRIPEYKFGGSESLISLNLSYNFLSSIERLPWEILIYLDLRANLLQGQLPILPSSAGFFFISNNRLTGEIPSTICNLRNSKCWISLIIT
jgi:Leucine-rich repeat (LRR) protein